ncbi:MAG TPA: hypothetical protein DIT10_14715 [Chryseobacterium sp.]|nr:hypothetical protein [Chryseobacterium sp.]
MLFYFEGAKRGINELIRLSGGIMVCDFLKIEVTYIFFAISKVITLFCKTSEGKCCSFPVIYFIIENPLKKGAFCYICRKTNCFGISAIVSIKFKNNYEINFKNL